MGRSVRDVGIGPTGRPAPPPAILREATMLIECESCVVRGPACAGCVVSVLLGAPSTGHGEPPELDGAERAALAVLAGSGLVPPLRLVRGGAASRREVGALLRPEGESGHAAAG